MHLLESEFFDLSHIDFEMENAREMLMFVAPLFEEKHLKSELWKSISILTALRTMGGPEQLYDLDKLLPDGWKYTLPDDVKYKLQPMDFRQLRGDLGLKRSELQSASQWLKMVSPCPEPCREAFECARCCLADSLDLMSGIHSCD